MLGCGVPYTGFMYFLKTLSALFGPSHAGKHPTGNSNDIIFLFLPREYVLYWSIPNVKRENVFTILFATTSLCHSYLKCHAF